MEVFKGRPYCRSKSCIDSENTYSINYTLYRADKNSSIYLDRMYSTKHVQEHYIIICDKDTIEYKYLKIYYNTKEYLRRLKLKIKTLLFRTSLEATVESLQSIDPVVNRGWGYEKSKHDELIEV